MKNLSQAKRAKSVAFTLIEMLVVIAIIAILVSLTATGTMRARRKAMSIKALSNAKQIGAVNMLYAVDHKGKLLGQGDSWNDTLFLFENFTSYLTNGSRNPSEKDMVLALKQVVDPMVPKGMVTYGEYPYTWSINAIFNTRTGRFAQGLDEWGASEMRARNLRSLTEFSSPSTTIYAVSGGYQLKVNHVGNEALLQDPNGRQPIFYFYGNGQATPAVFLDGHVTLMTYPIPEEMIIPVGR